MTYEEWEASAAPRLGRDRLWRMRAYRLACYVGRVGWGDARAVVRDPLARDLGPQLVAALGSIRTNIAEGYSRSGGRDRVRFFEYALGSARESREWYLHAEPLLGESLVAARCEPLEEVIRILLAIIPRERSRSITSEADEPRHQTRDKARGK